MDIYWTDHFIARLVLHWLYVRWSSWFLIARISFGLTWQHPPMYRTPAAMYESMYGKMGPPRLLNFLWIVMRRLRFEMEKQFDLLFFAIPCCTSIGIGYEISIDVIDLFHQWNNRIRMDTIDSNSKNLIRRLSTDRFGSISNRFSMCCRCGTLKRNFTIICCSSQSPTISRISSYSQSIKE